MEIKFTSKKKRIALKNAEDKEIGHIFINPEDTLERNAIFELLEEIHSKEAKIDALKEEIDGLEKEENRTQEEELEILGRVAKAEKELFDLMYNKFCEIWGEGIEILFKEIGYEVDVAVTLIQGITPYYKEISQKNIEKYIKEE